MLSALVKNILGHAVRPHLWVAEAGTVQCAHRARNAGILPAVSGASCPRAEGGTPSGLPRHGGAALPSVTWPTGIQPFPPVSEALRQPWFAGTYWWACRTDPTEGAPADIQFTAHEKPAEVFYGPGAALSHGGQATSSGAPSGYG